jgi:predicted transcriptional regulator
MPTTEGDHINGFDASRGTSRFSVSLRATPMVLQMYHRANVLWRPPMAATTTIRLPPKLRARIHALARQSGRSAHSVILEAVERHADYEEQMRSLVEEAIEADAEIERTGEVYRAEDVHAWMERLARGATADRPKTWRR